MTKHLSRTTCPIRRCLSAAVILLIATTACRSPLSSPPASSPPPTRLSPSPTPGHSSPIPTPTPPTSPAATPPPGTPSTLYLPIIGGSAPSPVATSAPPSPDPTVPGPTPLPPPVPKPNLGVQVHLFSANDSADSLHLARGLGAGWIKQQVEWHTVEHGRDDFEWGPLDQAVEAANAFGFKLLLGVTHAPDWTRASQLESGPPADYAEFGRFMGQLASRYRGRVAAYELWNEPNLAREWRGDTLDPARFVALVAEGSQAVRSGDPAALVISGAPAVTGINDGVTAIDDRVYLRGMVAAGVSRWVDGIGAHPYGHANPPDESWQDPAHVATSHNDHPSFFFRDTLEDYHAIMLESGHTDHVFWVTEFGWPCVENMGSIDTTGLEYAGQVSEAQQADYIVRAVHMGQAWPWVGPMFLWNLDLAILWGSSESFSAYSLVRPEGDYRPAYIALRLAEPRAAP